MNRTVVAVFSLLLTTAALADEAQRYLVATRTSLRLTSQSDAAVVLRDIEPRRVGTFRSFRGFAADLTASEVAKLRKSGDVRWIEPVLPRYAAAIDTDLHRQIVPWGIDNISARQAWAGRRTAVINVVVADTGVDENHPDLREVFAGGWDTFTKTAIQVDHNGHGTHVAGTIAAVDNQQGVVGVAPQVRLWSAKVLDANGQGSTETMIAAIDWTLAQKQALGGQWVVNFSLGAAGESPGEREAMQRAWDAGVIVVAAAGNMSGTDKPAPVTYPGAYPSVVAVGATTPERQIAAFSGQGPELDLTAPGVDVLSTVPTGSRFITFLKEQSDPREVHALVGSGVGTVSAPYVYCGVGEPDEMPESLAGKIALFQRGVHKFAEKARRAVARGAVGVVIYNNVEIMNQWTLFAEPEDRDVAWPIAIQLTREEGEELRSHSGTLTLSNERYDYDEKGGTSMATPHVAGAVALLWSMAPTATPPQILEALYSTATDLGTPGSDPVFGWGEVNVYAAAKQLAPQAFAAGRRRAVGAGSESNGSTTNVTQPATLSSLFAVPETEAGETAGAAEVVVVKIGADGKPILACVGNETAARRFLEAKPDAIPTKQPKDH